VKRKSLLCQQATRQNIVNICISIRTRDSVYSGNMEKSIKYSRVKIRQSGQGLGAKKAAELMQLRLERGYHALQTRSDDHSSLPWVRSVLLDRSPSRGLGMRTLN
jgi:hypothetical protein